MNNLINTDDAKSGDQDAIKQKLERLKTLFLLGDISEETYLTMRDEINQVLLHTKPKILDFDSMNKIASIIKDIKSIWEVAILEEQDKLAKILFQKIYINKRSVGSD